MSPARILILVVAAVSALGLAFLVRGIAGGKKEPQTVVQTVEKPQAKVLVASRDLAVGARLTPEDMKWQAWPVDSVNEAYITDGSVALPKPAADAEAAKADEKKTEEKAGAGDEAAKKAAELAAKAKASLFSEGGPMEALTGAIVREALLKGDPIIERKLVRADTSGVMAVVLQPGMRAMAIPVGVESSAGGFILPGDRVDVLLSRQVPGANNTTEFRSETVMRNVKVLAIDQITRPEDGAQFVVGGTATLEVEASDAEALAEADAQGDLSLLLRSYADVGGPSGRTARPQLARDTSTVRVWREGAATAVAVQ